MKTMKSLTIPKSKVIKLLQRLGFKQAHKYQPGKLLHTLSKLPDEFDNEEPWKLLGSSKPLLKELLIAIENGVSVRISEDLKGSVSMPRGKAREVDEDEVDQDEEEMESDEEEEDSEEDEEVEDDSDEDEEVDEDESEEEEDEAEDVEAEDESEEDDEEEEIPRKKSKGKASKAQKNGKVAKKPAIKRSSGPSNKEMVYKGWKKSKFKASNEELHAIVAENGIAASTISSWKGAWRHGHGIPKAYNTPEESSLLRKQFGTKKFPSKSEKKSGKEKVVAKKGKPVVAAKGKVKAKSK